MRETIADRFRRSHPALPTHGSDQQTPPLPKLSSFGKIRLAIAIRSTLMKRASWKTTLGGIIALIGPVLPQILPPEFAWIGQAVSSLGVAFGLISARDNNKSSEDVGVK